MQKRSLGKTGYEVGEVGLGCWQLGGDWGSISDQQAFAILEAAHLNGIDFFDTADVYGNGRSERLIGEFCHAQGIRPVIATKHGRDGIYPDRYTEEALLAGVEGSCERLGIDRIDLLQLHCIPSEILKRGEIFGWLDALVTEGTIRGWGASVESVDEGLLCLEQPGCCTLQVILNFYRQKPVLELLPKAAAAGVGIIARLPLASGLLSGKFTTNHPFPITDHRNFNRDGKAFNVGETFAGLPFELGVELSDDLRECTPERLPMSQWALRWILDHPQVSTVIPGASTVEQVSSNAAASDLDPLDAAAHEELWNFYQTRVADYIRGPN